MTPILVARLERWDDIIVFESCELSFKDWQLFLYKLEVKMEVIARKIDAKELTDAVVYFSDKRWWAIDRLTAICELMKDQASEDRLENYAEKIRADVLKAKKKGYIQFIKE